MADYIDRNEAIAALIEFRDVQRFSKYATASDFISAIDAIERATKVLESLPAADVKPVKRGKLLPQILNGTRIWDCSECKTIGSPAWKRCPVCEAKMNEEVET